MNKKVFLIISLIFSNNLSFNFIAARSATARVIRFFFDHSVVNECINGQWLSNPKKIICFCKIDDRNNNFIIPSEQQIITNFIDHYAMEKNSSAHFELKEYFEKWKVRFEGVRQFVKSGFAASMICFLEFNLYTELCVPTEKLKEMYETLLFLEFLLSDDVDNTEDIIIVNSPYNFNEDKTVTFVQIKKALLNIKDATERELKNREVSA